MLFLAGLPNNEVEVGNLTFKCGAVDAAPILRWAGSKRKVTSLLLAHVPSTFRRYVEPFAGSAALFFALKPQAAALGDANTEVAETYKAVRNTPEEVDFYLRSIPHTKDAFLALRETQASALQTSQRAARLIFLMKACFNGVYRTNREGKFNVPFGTRIYRLPELDDLHRVSTLLQTTDIRNCDYKACVADAGPGDFVYLDPPYSSCTRYRGEYGYAGTFRSEHVDALVDCCNALTARGANVMLSYKWDAELVRALRGWNIRNVQVPRSVSAVSRGRAQASEMLALNY